VGLEIDTVELRRRVRRASGNPFVRAVRFRHAELHPRDLSWWAGGPERRAELHLGETDFEALEYVRRMSPEQHRRLLRLLADLLGVAHVRLLACAVEDGRRGGLGRVARLMPSLRHQPVAELLQGGGVDQLQRPQVVE
jgi:hypothetical protein